MFPRLMFVLILAVATSIAGPIIDFQPTTAGGTIGYTAGGPLVGTGILVGQVKGLYTPLHDNLLPAHEIFAVDAVLSFTTGAFAGMVGGNYTFAAGSGGAGDPGITIVGTIPGMGITVPTTLLSGKGVSATVQPNYGASGMTVALTTGFDVKDPALVAFFGLPADVQFAFTGSFQINPVFSGWGFAPTTVISYDLSNTTVPEPASYAMIGGGLLLVAYCARKRFNR